MKALAAGALAVGAVLSSAPAWTQEVMRDLEGKDPHTLTVDEVKALMPGARVKRMGQSGSTMYWTNEPDGTFLLNTDNRQYGNTRATTAPGKWNITDDGRYCVLIEYHRNPPEQWCRFLIKTSDGYFGTTSTASATQRVYKLEISK